MQILILKNFENTENECKSLLQKNLSLPAYDQCLKASHIFNLLDARGVIGVAERTGYITRIRACKRMRRTMVKLSKLIYGRTFIGTL